MQKAPDLAAPKPAAYVPPYRRGGQQPARPEYERRDGHQRHRQQHEAAARSGRRGDAKQNGQRARERDGDDYQYIGKLHKTILYNQKWCDYICQKHITYMKLMCGINLRIKLTPETQPYCTAWESRRQVDRLLRTEFACRPIIYEPMCGSGFDIMWSLLDLDPRQVLASDMMRPELLAITRDNILSLYAQYDNFKDETINEHDSTNPAELWLNRVCLHCKYSWVFIKEYAQAMDQLGREKIFHLIMLDAPWDARLLGFLNNEASKDAVLNADATAANEVRHEHEAGEAADGDGYKPDFKYVDYEDNWVSPKLLFEHLVQCVFRPMKKAGIKFHVVCLKVRWEMTPELMIAALGKNDFMNEHFDVQYAMQCLPNIRNTNRKEDPVTKKYYIVDEHLRRQLPDPHGAQKGEFHFVILRTKEYEGYRDERGDFYDHVVLAEDSKNTALWVDRNSYIKPYMGSYSNDIIDPTIYEEDVYNKKIQLGEVNEEDFAYVQKSVSRSLTMIADLQDYVNQIVSWSREAAGTSGPAMVSTNKKKILSTIEHVKKFYIETQDRHINSKGNTADHIKDLVKTLEKEVDILENILDADKAKLPVNEAQYLLYFEETLKALGNGEPVVAAKSTRQAKPKTRLLDLLPHLLRCIHTFRQMSPRFNAVQVNQIEGLITEVKTSVNRVQRAELQTMQSEILKYTIVLNEAAARPFDLTDALEQWTRPKKLERENLHKLIMTFRNNYNSIADRMFEKETIDSVDAVSKIIDEFMTIEMRYYCDQMKHCRDTPEEKRWADEADVTELLQNIDEYCNHWYIRNDMFNETLEQNLQRISVAALEQQIKETRLWLNAILDDMHLASAPKKMNKSVAKAQLNFGDNADMSTLLSLLRNVCAEFRT